MSNRTLDIVLLVVGVLIVVDVLLSAQLGLASAGFGMKKIAGLVVHSNPASNSAYLSWGLRHSLCQLPH
jgi:hypothetical protein